ncbi:MAG: hypothetical protein LJE68_03470 [Rhodobacter sp.]|nr:hypothetical protein [Rhodobacter sp.]
MLGEVLHSFFFGMPAILAITASFGLRSPVARMILFWGGVIFAVLIWAGLAGMLLCDGRLLSGYSGCAGGDAITALFARLDPLLSAAAYVYILAGPPLTGLAYLLEWLFTRRATA